MRHMDIRSLIAGAAGACILVLALEYAGPGASRGRASHDPPLPLPATARVSRIIDGDTFVADADSGAQTHVRVIGIDTPELHEVDGGPHDCGADAARDLAQKLLAGRRVRLTGESVTHDVYGRALADVQILDGAHAGADYGSLMAAAGAARLLVIPPNDAHATSLHALAAQAQARSAGLWGSCSPPGATLMSPRQR
jgi:micrococcal nuclease